MDWIKKNPDRVLLAVFAAALLGCAGFVVLTSRSFSSLFAGRNSTNPPNNTIVPPSLQSIQTALTQAKEPRTWGAYDGSLLISRPYVLRGGKLFDPLEGGEKLHPPIENAWLQKYDLDYANPRIKEEDPDNDKFSNLEEFLAATDPQDPNSFPGYWTKLRLSKFDPVPFLLKFSGTPDDGQTYTINTRDRRVGTQFLKLGDKIEGAPYRLLSYQKKSAVRNEIDVDLSELTIENTLTGRKIVLVFDQEANDPTSYGEFLYLYDNSTFRVKIDDDFTLTPQTERKYKLIDISASDALIQDLETGEKHKIPHKEN